MRQPVLQPMSLGQILDGAFTLYRRHFGSMVGIMVVLYGPVMIGFAIVVGSLITYAPETPDVGAALAFSGLLFTLLVVALLAYTAAEGALTKAVSDVFLTGTTSLGSACVAALGRLLHLVGGAFLKLAVFLAATLAGGLLLIPLVIALTVAGASQAVVGIAATAAGLLVVGAAMSIGFAVVFAVTPVIMLEREGPVRAVARSTRLSRGRWIRILAVLGVAFLIGSVLGGGGALLLLWLVPNPIASQVLQQVVAIVFAPYYAICVVLLYYDARMRSEGFDLEVMARQLHPEEGPA